MNAPNRSSDVAAWVASHRALFTGDAEDTTRQLLTPLARHLNAIEGRDVWGLLVKTDRTPPFVPHDILMWKDTREHFDVFTGPDSGRAEDVQPVWGYNPPPDNDRWIWQSVALPAAVDVRDRDFVRAALRDLYASYGYLPTGPGTGPTDIEYYADVVIQTGGWTHHTDRDEDNINYWTDRVREDLIKAGMPILPPLGTSTPPVPVPEPPPPPPVGTSDLEDRVRYLEGLVGEINQSRTQLAQRVTDLEQRPAPTMELPELVAEGNTSRVWGHGHTVKLAVHPK